MIYMPNVQEPKQDVTGAFHCKDCGMILPFMGYYCDKCYAKREERTKMFFKKYWWLMTLGALILFIIFLILINLESNNSVNNYPNNLSVLK